MADHGGPFCPFQRLRVSLNKRECVRRGVMDRVMMVSALRIDYKRQGKDQRGKFGGHCNNPGKRRRWPGPPVRAMTRGHVLGP